MINKKYLKLLRSNKNIEENNFIYDILAKRIIDSIDLLKIDINNVLEIGVNDNITHNYLQKRFVDVSIFRSDVSSSIFKNKQHNYLKIDLDDLDLNHNFYELVYSNCFIYLSNKFENCLNKILQCLKPNGFFITAIPDKENIYQLLNCMYEADLSLYGGAYQRINPTVDINNILNILKKLNFDTPSVYSDTISISYTKFDKLIKDVQNMKLTYCHTDKKQNFENKKYFFDLKNIYKEKYFDQKFLLDVKINFVSAWKK